MSAIGSTSFDGNENISILLNPTASIIKKQTKTDDKLKHSRSGKFSDQDIEQLSAIMLAIGTDKVSKALRWCLEKAWESHGEEIEKIAAEKRKIGTL